MRRLASLFKRNDKSASISSSSTDSRPDRTTKLPSAKSHSRLFKSLSVRTVKPAAIREPSPQLSQPPLHASSLSTSSTDSPSPATPDDDYEFAPNGSHRNSNQWPERKLVLPLPTSGASFDWNPSLSLPPISIVSDPSDPKDDDGSSTTSSSPSVSSPVSPHQSLQSLTTCALAPTFSAPPLLYLPNVPLFPRSINSLSSLPHQETVAARLFRTQMLRRLQRRDLSVSEERSIASFTSHRSFSVKSQFPLVSKLDNGPVSDLKRVSNVSQGLKQWVSRPCFEDRVSVYTPGPSGRPDDIIERNVSGGVLGVAALELSEIVQVLAGHNVQEQSELPWLPALSSSSTTDLELSNPAPVTSSAINPPLRTGTTRSLDQTKKLLPKRSSLQPSLSLSTPPSNSSANVTPRPKRPRSSVRFDVDEKQDKDNDEHVPLGHIMRIKRGREERTKFLELQRDRRALEEEKQKHEAEKRKWEQERRIWEAERKAVEEEKKKRLFQQEVIAARKRRESQMFKVGAPLTDPPEIEPQDTRKHRSHSRPAYDSLRGQTLDGSSPTVSQPPSRNDSFASLRGISKPQSLRSVPPPSADSSNTDEGAHKSGTGRPMSMLPCPSPQLPMVMPPYGYPWGMPVMPQMVPQMLYYPMDNMPLLPPTAPFMMHQTGDRRSSISSSPNRSSTSIAKSPSQSMDRLPGTSPTRRPLVHQRGSSGGSSNQFWNGQQSNPGSANSSRRSSGIVADPNQSKNSTSSRPSLPRSYSQRPVSWVVPSPVPHPRQNTIS